MKLQKASPEQIKSTLRTGLRLRFKGFSLSYQPLEAGLVVAVIASKKSNKLATRRNWGRRMVTEALRFGIREDNLKVNAGIYIFILNANLYELDFKNIVAEIISAIEKIKK